MDSSDTREFDLLARPLYSSVRKASPLERERSVQPNAPEPEPGSQQRWATAFAFAVAIFLKLTMVKSITEDQLTEELSLLWDVIKATHYHPVVPVTLVVANVDSGSQPDLADVFVYVAAIWWRFAMVALPIRDQHIVEHALAYIANVATAQAHTLSPLLNAASVEDGLHLDLASASEFVAERFQIRNTAEFTIPPSPTAAHSPISNVTRAIARHVTLLFEPNALLLACGSLPDSENASESAERT